MSGITKQIADFVSGFDDISLPEEAIVNAKMGIVDCLGVALAGTKEQAAVIIRNTVTGNGQREDIAIWGTKHKASLLDAVLVNGLAAHVLDFDDCNDAILGHPSAVLVPTVFALAEENDSSGFDLIKAYICGFEVMAALGKILNPELYEKGWHPTAVLGVFGACISASRLLKLNFAQTVNALGIAATEASGIKRNFGTMTKPYHAGSAAKKGVYAAILAREGFTASKEVFDGKQGFIEIYKGPQTARATQALFALGANLEICASGIDVKQYPCCRSTHASLDGILDLIRGYDFTPHEIKNIICTLNPQRIPHIDRVNIATGYDGKFSLQYCIAVGILEKQVTLKHFQDISIEKQHKDLMSRIAIIADPCLAGFEANVAVELQDGRSLVIAVPEPRGSAKVPLAESEIKGKFINTAIVALETSTAKALYEKISNLEHTENIKECVKILNLGIE